MNPRRVVLDEVSRAYGRHFVLHRITTEFSAPSVSAVIGDNGAGKSTLLQILATIDEPTSGTVHFDDQTAAAFARRRRHRIGWVGHQPMVYDELTARENLHFFGAMYGLSDAPRRAQGWLQRMGLEHAADRPVRAFSRGMKQRLTLARSLLHGPQLVLLDEPSTGLDRAGRALLRELLTELRERDRLVILVTHDLTLAHHVADRTLLFRRGKIAADLDRSSTQDLPVVYDRLASEA